MRLRYTASLAVAASFVLAACGGDSTPPPVATTIVVSPGTTFTFPSVNATQQLSAKVLDQRGDSMAGVVVGWSSANTVVATVSASGMVTAKGNGSGTVTASVGDAHTDVSVTVSQVATAILKTAGDFQSGSVGQVLPISLGVTVIDAGGSPVPGVAVTFNVSSGGGTVADGVATTNASGVASTTWTLGTNSGLSQVVQAASGALGAVFSAAVQAGLPATVTMQAGNNQSGLSGLAVAVKPSVRVADSFGNARGTVAVVFAVASGGGSVTGATQTTDPSGIATVGSWTLGGSGANTLTASVPVAGVSVTFDATALVAGPPTMIKAVLGSNQIALLGYPTNIRPAVRVTDAANLPVSGVSVTFAVASGGGTVTNATVNTNVNGVAQVGSWTVGGTAGDNTLSATAAPAGLSGNPVTFTSTGQASAFNITLMNTGPALSPAVQAAFDSAQAFWERALITDIADHVFNLGAGFCGTGSPAFTNQPVDDVIILVNFSAIDGPSGILGQAGACTLRPSGMANGGLPFIGTMRFDTADVTGLINSGALNTVIRHEMGHVLGFSSGVWGQSAFGCVQSLSSSGNAQDTHFSCPRGREAFDSIGGTSYTGGNKVPVENCGPATMALVSGCGGGNYNSHWREPTFNNEMMTGYLNSGVANPASLVTIAAMEDLGYGVNYGAAETYTRVFTLADALRASTGTLIDLERRMLRVPMYIVDRRGRVLRVIQP